MSNHNANAGTLAANDRVGLVGVPPPCSTAPPATTAALLEAPASLLQQAHQSNRPSGQGLANQMARPSRWRLTCPSCGHEMHLKLGDFDCAEFGCDQCFDVIDDIDKLAEPLVAAKAAAGEASTVAGGEELLTPTPHPHPHPHPHLGVFWSL